MTKDNDLIAAFMAKRGATQCVGGIAYGVDKDADKAKRLAAREAERAQQIERDAEQYVERVREARHVGGLSAAIDAMNDWGRR